MITLPHLALFALLLVPFSRPADAEEIPSVLGISHVAVKATDVERSVAFYRDFLGFAEQGRLNYFDAGALMLVYMKVSDDNGSKSSMPPA